VNSRVKLNETNKRKKITKVQNTDDTWHNEKEKMNIERKKRGSK
jgi:hypothetical protein